MWFISSLEWHDSCPRNTDFAILAIRKKPRIYDSDVEIYTVDIYIQEQSIYSRALYINEIKNSVFIHSACYCRSFFFSFHKGEMIFLIYCCPGKYTGVGKKQNKTKNPWYTPFPYYAYMWDFSTMWLKYAIQIFTE